MGHSSNQALIHTAFYLFVKIDDPETLAVQLRKLADGLLGSVLVASEGINGTLAGTDQLVSDFEHHLHQDARFSRIAFKHSSCTTPPFAKLKITCKNEIVTIGVAVSDLAKGQEHSLSPQAWRELLRADDVVLLDNRNSFEYRLGHFQGAIDPKLSHYKDFADYLETHLPNWQAHGKRLAMYCTGGIRCEKTAAWLAEKNVPVYQLEGGILNYFEQLPDADKDWQGECFVFDNRVALDTHLQETTTSIEQVYETEPDGQWRIARAKRLLAAVETDVDDPKVSDAQ